LTTRFDVGQTEREDMMERSTDRILTTHTGSLPRPEGLRKALRLLDTGGELEAESFAAEVRAAVAGIVERQQEIGLDAINDGEMSKVSYVTYVSQRLSGFGGRGRTPMISDARDFPEWAHGAGLDDISDFLSTPACVGDVAYANREMLAADIENLLAACRANGVSNAFLTSASPGVISFFLENQFYRTHEEYVAALAAAMKTEYDAIHAAGFVLQVDCPDLAMGRHNHFLDKSLEEWRAIAMMHVEALNDATRDIPPEAMRIHLCWGNYAGPHHLDVPLGQVLDIVLRARPAAISFEAANPRHAHEWKVFEDVALPEGKVLIPGVIDSTTNYVEHPELVAERLLTFARIVGRENVVAGTDCGFATASEAMLVDARIVEAKLRSLVDGAVLASDELWRGRPAHAKV
jgi:5-methyltetrahydropteroyltriglutamate--homocysteine methyltransferase